MRIINYPLYVAAALIALVLSAAMLASDRSPSAAFPACSNGQVIKYSSTTSPTFLDCGTLAFSEVTGSVAASQMPALTGDVTTSAGAVSTTIGSGKVTSGMLASQSFVVTGFHSFCTGGTMASSSTVFMPGFGGVATTCTGLGTSRTGGTATGAGTIKNLRVNMGTGGKSGDAVTVEIAGSASALTCTFGTGTSCSDVTHTAAVTAGQVLTVKVTTGTSETAANIAVYFELWN